jgi:hypothetical protein
MPLVLTSGSRVLTLITLCHVDDAEGAGQGAMAEGAEVAGKG